MNPSPYGQQYPPQGWPQPPQQQQQQQQPPVGGPPPGMPPHSQGMLNGNYQQQLVNSMGGMSVNAMKGYPPAGGNLPPPPMGNGSDSSIGGNNNIIPNNNSIGMMGYPNGPMPPTSQPQSAGPPPMQRAPQGGPPPQTGMPPQMPPMRSSAPTPPLQQTQGAAQLAGPQKPGFPSEPPRPNENSFPPRTHSNHSAQMTAASPNLPGMPHMPPPKTSSPFMPPQAGEQQKPQDAQRKDAIASQYPPQPQMQQKFPPQVLPPSSQSNNYPQQQNELQQQQQPQQQQQQQQQPQQQQQQPQQQQQQPQQQQQQPQQQQQQPQQQQQQQQQQPPQHQQQQQQPQQQQTQPPMQFGPPRPGQQMPPQPGQMPPQPGQTPSQPGQMPTQPGRIPPQPGQMQMPPQSGSLPPQPGQMQMPSQPGKMPPQPGQMYMSPQPGQMQMPPQPGQMQMPPKPGQMQMPPQPGQMPPQPGQMQMPPQPGQMQMPPQPGQMPPQPGQMQMPPQPGQMQMPPRPGQMQAPPQPGQMRMPPQPGQMQMPPQPGQMSMPPQPGQMQMPGQLPPMPGQLPPMPGQLPPMPGQLPPMPGQLPPMPGQLPPQPGQMPFQQGSGAMQYQTGPAPQQPGQMPSYPPQPGQMSGQQMPGRGFNQPPGMYNQQYQQQPAAMQRRLDPDQMPNPIQVMIENQRSAGGAFVTNQPGLLPPLVTTKFVVQDQGNSSPRLVRSSLYCVPSTADLLKTTALPFSLIVSPYAKTVEGEYDAPIIDFGELGPIRCHRCKAYMSPNMQFVDAGRRFQCLMCKVSTEVPTEYFQHLDHTGQRVDKYERPELVLGTYEFVATKDYCRNNTPPEIPAFVFIIDVSYNNVKSGLVHLLCQEIKNIIKHFPVDQGQEKSKMRVGFITYNSTVHFYNIKSTLAQPQMMVVGDITDMFMPLLDGFLVDPEESEGLIDALMTEIPKMFVDTKETETILLPAIQAGLEALKASNCAGKLLVFNSSLPIHEAPGKLRNRDDRKLLGTEKEKTILTPQITEYNNLGQECVQVGCSVDLFLFNNSYIDIATIGQVSRLTGGEVYKYTYFQAELDGKRLIEDIIKNVSRPIAFDAVMRVRTSAGIRATDFYGHFFMSNTTDVELASVDCNKAIAIEIKHDDKLPPEENIYLQIALLYTSSGGQRRLRVLNLALKVTTTIADVFKSCDLDTIILFFAKQSMFKLMELTPKAVKDNLIHRSAQILACYRKHCTSPTSAGQLILPECLKLLPLYVSCLIKNDAISGGSDMTTDDRSYVIQFVLSMDLQMSVTFFYPRFIPIHNVEPDENDLPLPMRVTHEKMAEDGAYILENGVYLFFWLGQSLAQSFVQPLFNVQCTQQVNAERFAIVGDNPLARRVQQIIDTIMQERTRYMRVTCVRQNDKLESVFRHFLIEDRGTDGSASYVDFLCHMHKEIKDLLS